MIGIIIGAIGAAIGVGCLIYAKFTKTKCIQLDQQTATYNEELIVRNHILKQENENNLNFKQQILEEIKVLLETRSSEENNLNQLLQSLQLMDAELNLKRTQMQDLTQHVDALTSHSKETVRAAFESYCDILDFQYAEKEREFDEDIANLDQLYDQQQDAFLRQMADNEREFNKRREECERDLGVVRSELAKIKASKAAAIEAQLREQEIKNKATFYTLQLNEADMRDVAYLKSIEFNLREARPLRMLIWSTFYRDKLNDLAARVGAVGACGIYKITHADSGISYIGQAKDIKSRWADHVKCALGIDTPVTSTLYAFMRDKGVDSFTFEVLEKCSAAELNEKEKFYIDLYQTYEFGLNGNKGIGK